MNKIDELAKTLTDSANAKDKKKTSAYDTTANVVKVEGGTAWVSIPGGVEQTPATMAVSVKAGDEARVRVAGGKAYVVGNVTSPPTDDSYAKQAEAQALRATRAADAAIDHATRAERAANSAIADAASANTSATNALKDAATARASAESAVEDAANAQAAAESAQADATTAKQDAASAKTSANEAKADAATAATAASEAQTSADSALSSARSATQSANGALNGLSTVQDVIGVLDWAKDNATYTLTSDTDIVPGKTYWTRSGSGTEADPYTYAPVVTPVKADLGTYYEISGVDEAMADYINTHLALTDEGLWLVKDGSGYKLKLTNYGSYIVAPDGTTVVNQNTADGNIIRALDGTVIAHFGYGEGVAQSGRSEKPYYILGKKATTTAVYDSTNTYKTGSLVLYGDPQKLYVCIKEITTPESWNSSHWQLVIGNYSVAEGYETKASGWASHAEGNGSTASGSYSHAEGAGKATGSYGSHAEGNSTASGNYSSHAEGFGCTASGELGSHAEGYQATASGQSSHAEGDTTTASGHRSHAQNKGTEAGYQDQTAIGRYNDNQRGNAFEIGNGTDTDNRSNAFTADWEGNVKFAGVATGNNGTRDIELNISEATISAYVALGMSLS